MIKPILLILIMTLCFFGCEFNESHFEEHKDITQYVVNKYAQPLKEANVKFLKCYPNKNGIMKVVYTTNQRDNSFPAVIRFDYVNKSYNVYFDNSYLNGPKKELITDIDECFECWLKLKDAKQTWQ